MVGRSQLLPHISVSAPIWQPLANSQYCPGLPLGRSNSLSVEFVVTNCEVCGDVL